MKAKLSIYKISFHSFRAYTYYIIINVYNRSVFYL